MAHTESMLAIAIELGEAAVKLDRYRAANRERLTPRQELELKRSARKLRQEVDNIAFEASSAALDDVEQELEQVRLVAAKLNRAIDTLDNIENLTAATAATFALVAAIGTADARGIVGAVTDLARKVEALS